MLVSSRRASGGDQSGSSKERTARGDGGLPRRGKCYLLRRERTTSTWTSVLMRLVARVTLAWRSSSPTMRGPRTRLRHAPFRATDRSVTALGAFAELLRPARVFPSLVPTQPMVPAEVQRTTRGRGAAIRLKGLSSSRAPDTGRMPRPCRPPRSAALPAAAHESVRAPSVPRPPRASCPRGCAPCGA